MNTIEVYRIVPQCLPVHRGGAILSLKCSWRRVKRVLQRNYTTYLFDNKIQLFHAQFIVAASKQQSKRHALLQTSSTRTIRDVTLPILHQLLNDLLDRHLFVRVHADIGCGQSFKHVH